MSGHRLITALCAALLVAAAAHADVVLQGAQHTGDNDDANLTPTNPVARLLFEANPSHFHLSSQITITGLQLVNLASLDGAPRFVIDAAELQGTFDGGTGTLTLSNPLTLNAGLHTFAVDSGCLTAAENPTNAFDAASCTNEDNIAWSSVILLSGETSTSQMFNQRRHLGDFTGETDQYGGTFYPDLPDGAQITESFTLSRPLQTSTLALHNLRQITRLDAALNGTAFGQFTGTESFFTQQSISNTVTLPVGTHSITITSPGSGNIDDVSWDDMILQFAVSTTTLPNHFNAVDPGQAGGSGVITTKVAGAAFNLDIHSLAADDSATSNYTGTVLLELLDARDDSGPLDIYGCRSSWSTVGTLGSVGFAGSGQQTAMALSHPDALRIARIRISDSALNLSTCSSDAFALRPAQFAITASDDTDSTPGTARVLNNVAFPLLANPVHRAGQPFTLTITPQDGLGNPIAGLDTDPALSPTALAPASVTGSLTPGVFTTQGNLRVSDTARYSEVGALNVLADLTSFSDVDAADTPLAARTLTQTVAIGRFVPNQFAVVANTPELAPACVNHSYFGQGFGFATPPQLTLTAQDASGTTTSNYTGSLFRLQNNSATTPAYSVDSGTLVADLPAAQLTDLGAGQALANLTVNSLTMARGTPTLPSNPAIAVATSITDLDGIAALGNPQQFGAATPGNGIAFTGGVGAFRHGLLRMSNAFGSPLVALDVPLTVLFWGDLGGGNSGYTLDTDGACLPAIIGGTGTTLNQASLNNGATSVSSTTLAAGRGAIRLAAPGAGASGFVVVDFGLNGTAPWLTDGVDPTARASFSLKSLPDDQIHLREVIP